MQQRSACLGCDCCRGSDGRPLLRTAAAANDNSGMMSWDFSSGTDGAALFDGDLATPVGGDENGQHVSPATIAEELWCAAPNSE